MENVNCLAEFSSSLSSNPLTRQKLYLVGQSISDEGGAVSWAAVKHLFDWLIDMWNDLLPPEEEEEEEEKAKDEEKCWQVSTNSWVGKVPKQNEKTFNQPSRNIYFPVYLCSFPYPALFLPLNFHSSVKMVRTKLFRTLYGRIK